MQEPGNNELTNVYMTMFSDQRLRLDVETTIIISNPDANQFFPRRPERHALRLESVRNVIKRADERMETFVQEHPACKSALFGA